MENKIPLKKILAREVTEELGHIKYKLGRLLFQYRRYFEPQDIYILITVYDAKYLGGKIKLSNEHSSYHWINPKKFKFSPKDFWHKEEYNALIGHIKKK